MSLTLTFNNWIDFVEAAKHATPATEYHTSHDNSRPKWSGSANFAETVELAEAGWPEGAAKIKSLSSAIADKVESLIEVPTVHYDVTGDDFDVSTMLTGIPEYWERLETDSETAPVETLVVNVNFGFLCDVTVREVEVRGSAIAALVECLEFANKRVEVNIVMYSTVGRKEKFSLSIRLKDSEQFLATDTLAFAILHASCLRRLVFALMETDSGYMRAAGFSYGTTHDIPAADMPKGLYLPSQLVGQFREDNAVEWVTNHLKEQGVTIIE